MKTLLLVLLLSAPAFAVTCEKGCYEYRDECACDIPVITAPPVQPSDEKPPEGKMPSWQREGIQVMDAKNMAYEDAKADDEKREADEQGKKAAGIP